MNRYIGNVGGATIKHRVEIEGESVEDAMASAGYVIASRENVHGRACGRLEDGRRYTFRLQPAKHGQSLNS